ncbi:bifunctional phosphoribosylaminoimidazolecarboxamide formyltransferase/IMP cyclohydrolase [Candidatus Margulisiibacteriota bacterium]
MRALISVSDKTGIEELAKELVAMDFEIISTGGTSKALKKAGLNVKDISDITGFPEMLDGRVKTLHPKIHGGLLSLRANKEHMQTVEEHGIGLIDLVIVNLYPFEKTIQKEKVTLEEAIENIDIGGPSMLRSAAKNYQSVGVVTDPSDYPVVIKELKENNGQLTKETKEKLAVKVFEQTSYYDGLIFNYLKGQYSNGSEPMPEKFALSLPKAQELRYGENPHQKAAYYGKPYKQLQGKELSFNNIIDIDAAAMIVADFKEPAATVIKHTNPCGAATDKDIFKAYEKALAGDPVSAFGGIVGLNREVPEELAAKLVELFLEVIVAPSFSKEALKILKEKKNLRLIETDFTQAPYDIKRTVHGLLVQDRDEMTTTKKDLKTVTNTKSKDTDNLLFAWKMCRHVKSNAIVLAKDSALLGVGAGQMSRIDSLELAIKKSRSDTKGSVMASDAFFPFRDCVDKAKEAGITEIIQPGGSKRDQESIDACNEHKIAMLFTGKRHFKH